MQMKSTIKKELDNQGFGLVASNKKIGNKFYNVYSNGVFVVRVSMEYFTNTVWYNVVEYFRLNSDGEKADYTFTSRKVNETVKGMKLLGFLISEDNDTKKVICVKECEGFKKDFEYNYVKHPAFKRTIYVKNLAGIFSRVSMECFTVKECC